MSANTVRGPEPVECQMLVLTELTETLELLQYDEVKLIFHRLQILSDFYSRFYFHVGLQTQQLIESEASKKEVSFD